MESSESSQCILVSGVQLDVLVKGVQHLEAVLADTVLVVCLLCEECASWWILGGLWWW